jgi:indolepyruvate ferredoxin oxidoreductase alpha subunit
MKTLMTGNEAIARGAYEAGVTYACAYPGTPSTEILENTALYKEDLLAEWAPNEKVALESAIGASIAGARSFAAMKHVGVNVAADPLFSFAYTGVTGGMVLITADEPGQHSSQNEQDNRNYAWFAKIPLVEPSNSQESKDFFKEAFTISETFNTPVLFRITTRVCHSKSVVELQEREEVGVRTYEKNIKKYITVPAHSRILREELEERLGQLAKYAETTPLNQVEWHDKKIGIVVSGMSYHYAKEVYGDTASYLKLGFTHPMPMNMIRDFAKEVDTLYVIEENDPLMERAIKAEGISIIGKELFPIYGEMTSDRLREAAFGKTNPVVEFDQEKVVPRPPTLCAGCPHRGLFYELGKKKNVMITGDIGCYTLGFAQPYHAMDTTICMGASVSMGHGAQQVFNRYTDSEKRVVSVLGDSTFFHTGINSLLTVSYNRSNTVTIILDNRITGMTGHQQNPGTGYTLQGMPTKIVEIEPLVRACGIDRVRTIDPNRLDEVKEALDWALELDEPSVIITRWPCVLMKLSDHDVEEFGDYKHICEVETDTCIGCKKCTKTGCPAISFDRELKKSSIDPMQCVGCEVCMQVCPVGAIKVKGVQS